MELPIKKNKILYGVALSLLLFASFECFWQIEDLNDLSIPILFFLIAVLSVWGLFFGKEGNTLLLNTSFCLFYYFFFSICPIIQFKNKTVFQYSAPIPNEMYRHAGGVLLLVLIGYLLVYKIGSRYLIKCIHKITVPKIERRLPLWFCYICTGLAILLYFYLLDFNWHLLLFRPYAIDLKANTNFGLIGYSLFNILKLVPFVVFLLYQWQSKVFTKHSVVLLLFLLVTCFPTALSRASIAIIYMPVLLILVPKIGEKYNYLVVYLIGVLMIFPISNSFRLWSEGVFYFAFESFNSGDFDAFQNFALLLEASIVTEGRQLLGSILFFVPETIWIDRPIGSGAMLAEQLGFKHTNIAMPFFGEGFVNFGYFGILLFLLIITFFNVILDTLFLEKRLTTFWKYIFYSFLGIEFILMRGDLWNSIKIISSFVLAYFVVMIFYYLITNLKAVSVSKNLIVKK